VEISRLDSRAVSARGSGTLADVLDVLFGGISHDWFTFPSEDTDCTEIIYVSNKYLWRLVVENYRISREPSAWLEKYDLPYSSLAVCGGTGKLLGEWKLKGEALSRAVEVAKDFDY